MDKTNDTVNDNEEFTRKTWRDDVTFVVEGTQLYASKCVLAMYSPVFEAMFGSDFIEKETSVVELPDKKVKDFIEFLQCLFPTVKHYITEENVLQVLPLADKYQVASLKEECEEVIKNYISMDDGTLTTDDLLQCYQNINRHCHTDIESLCVDELVRRKNLEIDSSKAVNSFSKDEIIELQKNIISELDTRLEVVNTELARLYFKSKGTDLTAFVNAKGMKFEHEIDNVFDPKLLKDMTSKPVKLWDMKFYTSVSVVHSKDRGQSDKYLSVYLTCEFPDVDEDWSCDVQACILLENTSTGRDQTVCYQNMSLCHFTRKSCSLGYKTFEKLSKFLSETEKVVENYSCKFVVYILANQPTKIHEQDGEED